jgi:arylsulfatase A-like enzyme
VGRRAFCKSAIAAAASIPLLGSCTRSIRSTKPNFLVITLDTTRAHRLSCYGYDRPTTPNLDRLAEESVFYREAYSTSAWTLPAHASLFTGKFVTSHGARYSPDGKFFLSAGLDNETGLDVYRANSISRDETTLAQVLSEAGYATGAVVAGPWLKRVFGLDKGFSFYDDSDILTLHGRPAPSVTESALRWLDEIDGRPFVLFLNYFDPHAPYAIHEEFVRRYIPPDMSLENEALLSPSQARLVRNAMYDSEINFADAAIGTLLDGLRRQRLYDSTCIVITADHGELLGEHAQYGHGKNLYQEVVRIPMFIKYPSGDRQAAESGRRIQILDLFPMLLECAGATSPSGIQGVAEEIASRPTIAETFPLDVVSLRGTYQCIWDGPHKFILNSHGNHVLYDLSADPEERRNLVDEQPNRSRELQDRLITYIESLPPPGPPLAPESLDAETIESLRNLGYAE